MRVLIEGESFIGSEEKLVPLILTRGDQAEKNGENPHVFWQWAEHLQYKILGNKNDKQKIHNRRRQHSNNHVERR